MKYLNNSFLRSKFSMRIFLLFILSAVLPVIVVAALSFNHLSQQLKEQSLEQSRQTSKTIGMDLLQRLSNVSSELAEIAEIAEINKINRKTQTGNTVPTWKPRETHFEHLTALAIISSSGKISTLRGNINQIPRLTQRDNGSLITGKSVILSQERNNNTDDILMLRLLNPEDKTQGLIVGRISPDFLWSLDNLLSDSNEIFILDASNNVLFGRQEIQHSITNTLVPLLDTSITGNFEWEDKNETFIASYWSLFTQTNFSTPYLIIIISQPESTIFAPIEKFKRIYIPILILVILFISFFAVNRIRKRLIPLITLTDATKRIASGDFSEQINISSDDEIAQLGESFNHMSKKLDEQFTSISTMAEIDRLILSSLDARYIIETVLERAGDLTPCSVAAIIKFDDETTNAGKLSVRTNQSHDDIIEQDVNLSDEEIHYLVEHSQKLSVDCTADCPAYLKSIIHNSNIKNLLVFPALIKNQLASITIFGYQKNELVDETNIEQLRKFSDHVAVALSNSSWEERLYHQAHYDGLTNLPNRALLKDRLEQAITRAKRNDTVVGVIFLDLDRFKLVNDSLGHAAGDLLLKKTAEVLKHNVRSVDTVVRFGGDEFIIIIPDIKNTDSIAAKIGTILDKILVATKQKIDLDSFKVHSEMSMGITVYPRDGETLDELIKNADTAMYHAKEKGRGRYEFFAPEMNTTAARRMEIEQDIRHALENNEFSLNYQPKISSHSEEMVSAEALIRWHHPVKGFISPFEFIGIAEEVGLIHEIGDWVLNEACSQIRSWHNEGLANIRIAVNVSPRQFREGDLVKRVTELLKANQLKPDVLELEVTEGTVMEDATCAIEKLQAFRDMGIQLSVDDFGTGYSSLGYLRKLPINTLKIDRSFIIDMMEDEKAQAIVSSTITLAHNLGLNVIAEGVETHEQKDLLKSYDCDEFQGYLFSKPVSKDEFAELLRENAGGESITGLKSVSTGR